MRVLACVGLVGAGAIRAAGVVVDVAFDALAVRVAVLDAAALVFAFAALSRLSGRGANRYGIVWNRGCNEFELVSLGVAGDGDAGTGKRAWVEVEVLTTLGFVAVVSRLVGCSVDVGGVVKRGNG
jgi:hypothetical protein